MIGTESKKRLSGSENRPLRRFFCDRKKHFLPRVKGELKGGNYYLQMLSIQENSSSKS